MAMELDRYARLEEVCRDAANYPANDTRSSLFRHTLRSYKGRLAERSTKLFTPDPEYPIDFLEAYDGEDFKSFHCTEVAELEQHLWNNRKDPRRRHV